MKTIYIHIRAHIFLYSLTLLIIVISLISFNRFLINHDYVVEYEGTCDPVAENCFTGCENDDCTKEYYYSMVQKYAPDLYKKCGENITDCETANICLPEDRKCSIVYCDLETDDDKCETIASESDTQDLQINDTNI